MPDAPVTVRVTVRIRQQVEPALYEDLSVIGSYYRSKRLVQLAMLGLAAEQRGLRFDATQQKEQKAAQQQATTPTRGTLASVATPPAEVEPAAYEPNLGVLWDTGLMG